MVDAMNLENVDQVCAHLEVGRIEEMYVYIKPFGRRYCRLPIGVDVYAVSWMSQRKIVNPYSVQQKAKGLARA
ncbi:hypothetical protein [Xanthomonas fragariae]|uniref:hypothetical protein n=1 Tax=Xanthomonas fragariae TaxID=48664 RepID=UPI0022AB35BF|nr:hypothetical protein [Xanthomonas fragariae]WAT14427.1 hypothetical protein OZ429_15615 [Xanthomonas fragariae]